MEHVKIEADEVGQIEKQFAPALIFLISSVRLIVLILP
jgi:hypothetical protein